MSISKFKFNGDEYEVGGDYVHLINDYTIQSKKNFINTPTQPLPQNNSDLSNKDYTDSTIATEVEARLSEVIDEVLVPQTKDKQGLVKVHLDGDVLFIGTNEFEAFTGTQIPTIKPIVVNITDNLLNLSKDDKKLTLKQYYDNLNMPNPIQRTIEFYVKTGTILGSSDVNYPQIDIGSWAGTTRIRIIIEEGQYIVGKGGNGGGWKSSGSYTQQENGGTAIKTTRPIEIDIQQNSTLQGGGGGGQGGFAYRNGEYQFFQGSGGQGNEVGEIVTYHSLQAWNGNPGTLEEGGQEKEFVGAIMGKGGDLGEDGEPCTIFQVTQNEGGTQGNYIEGNEHVIWSGTGRKLGNQI